jgi:hypothetical protein
MVRLSRLATILAGITACLALGGCTVGTSDEYRTFDEVQAEKQARDAEQAQNAEAVDDETVLSDDTASSGDAADVNKANEEGQAEAIGHTALDVAPSGDAREEQILANAGFRGADDNNPLSGSGESTPPAELRAAIAAADASFPAEAAIDDSVSGGNPASNGGSEDNLAPPSSNSVAVRPADGSVTDLSGALSTAAREIKLLVPEKSFHTEGPEGALRVSYDDLNLLTILNMEPVPSNPEPYFPDWLRTLEGQRIRIRGFMFPAFMETGLRGFILVRDNQECCFGPGAKIYDHIEVAMRKGVTTDYIPGRPFDVVGRFHIRPEADDEELYQLYQLEDAIVIDQ